MKKLLIGLGITALLAGGVYVGVGSPLQGDLLFDSLSVNCPEQGPIVTEINELNRQYERNNQRIAQTNSPRSKRVFELRRRILENRFEDAMRRYNDACKSPEPLPQKKTTMGEIAEFIDVENEEGLLETNIVEIEELFKNVELECDQQIEVLEDIQRLIAQIKNIENVIESGSAASETNAQRDKQMLIKNLESEIETLRTICEEQKQRINERIKKVPLDPRILPTEPTIDDDPVVDAPQIPGDVLERVIDKALPSSEQASEEDEEVLLTPLPYSEPSAIEPVEDPLEYNPRLKEQFRRDIEEGFEDALQEEENKPLFTPQFGF